MNRRTSDVDARLSAWLEEGPTSGPEEVLSRTFARARSTRQDRVWLHRLTQPTRFHAMNSMLKVAAVVAFALAVGVTILPRGPDIGAAPAPSGSPSPEPAPLRTGLLPAGTYVTTPFAQPGSDACFVPPQDGCLDRSDDDAIRVTFTVPDGWVANGADDISLATGWGRNPEGAALIFLRGASLADDPCRNDGSGDIPVGPTVDDFVSALAEHPLLDVTTPVDVTIGGHAGKYVDLQVPSDPTIQGSTEPASQEGCPVYRPWDPWYLAQAPGERWHLWVLDVDGVRVVIQAMDREGTAPAVQAELRAIVESIRIEAPPAPAASASPGALAWSPASLQQDWPAPARPEPAGDAVVVLPEGVAAYADPPLQSTAQAS